MHSIVANGGDTVQFSEETQGDKGPGHMMSRRRSSRSSLHANAEKEKDNDMAAGHLRAKDIVHINTNVRGLECMQRLITPDKVTLTDVAQFLFLYAGSICVFAGLLYAVSPDGTCYKLEEPDHFGYETALFISLHSFSTIGFGSIAPRQRCTAAQLIIFVESFVALLVYGFISGYIVKIFIRPLSRIRFSKNLLLNHGRRRVEAEEDVELDSVRGRGHYKYLTFRMVRQGRVQMRNVHVRMQAQYWHAGKNQSGLVGREHHKGRVVTLSMEQDYFTTIEQLQVWHKLDEHSPLWKMRDHLGDHLDGVEVSVSAFDMASAQPVMMFKRYDVRDVIVNAVFDNNFAYNLSDKSGSQLQADHDRLDDYHWEFTEEREGSYRQIQRRAQAKGQVSRLHRILPSRLAAAFSPPPKETEDDSRSSSSSAADGGGDVESGAATRVLNGAAAWPAHTTQAGALPPPQCHAWSTGTASEAAGPRGARSDPKAVADRPAASPKDETLAA